MQIITNKTHFIEIPQKRYSDEFLAQELGIPLICIAFYDNWVNINNNWYYYKKIKNDKMLINELLGVEIAKFFDKSTVEYKVGTKNVDNQLKYCLLSQNFRKKEYEYMLVDELEIPNYEAATDSLINLENLRDLCKSAGEYNILLLEIFKMFVIDFYSDQEDRKTPNFMFEIKEDINLATLYDYADSFNNGDAKEIRNMLYFSDITSNSTLELLQNHLVFYKLLKKILSINIEELLKRISEQKNLSISSDLKEEYIAFDQKRKQLILNL